MSRADRRALPLALGMITEAWESFQMHRTDGTVCPVLIRVHTEMHTGDILWWLYGVSRGPGVA